MNKRLLKVSLTLSLVLATGGLANAQTPDTYKHQINPSVLKMTSTERALRQKEFKNNYPLLSQRKEIRPHFSFFPDAGQKIISSHFQKSAAKALLANERTEIWANRVSGGQGWSGPYGYYSFHPTSPLSFTSLFVTTAQAPASNGVQYSNGHIYGLSLDQTWAQYGIISEYLYDTDTNTGETQTEDLNIYMDMDLAATETAQSSDGTVYGEFYNEDGDGFEWGTIDYATKTRTTIAKATHTFVALGITKADQLYGVATDGNLYKIDKATGTETVVGPTGLTIAKDDGTYYGQTGEINQKDDAFYWAAVDKDQNGGLYEVNLSTGAATLISSNDNQLYGMIIPAPAAEDGAPAAATDLSLDFTGVSLDGTITFTAPTTTYAGDALTGDLTYTVKANDQTLATGTTQAGQTVTLNVSVPASGSYDFIVTTSNAIGESPRAKQTKWVGYDKPLPPTGITLTKNDGSVTIAWTAPTAGVHNGILGDLTYDVYRITGSDTVKVASDLTATTYTDDITGTSLGNYTYAVVAKGGGVESDPATSDGIVIGDAIEPDWTETFGSIEEFNLFTVLDANNDESTWRYAPYDHGARSNYNSSNGNDDWLFTPALHLTPGRLYTVTFKVRNSSSSYPNTLEAKWGNAATPEAMTNNIIGTFTPSDKDTTISVDINPAVDGKYYLGFHDNTAAANQMYVIIDSISVVRGAVGTAPRAVTDLTVTPGERGAMQATVSFTAPTLDIQGNSLSRIDSFTVKRDGVQIATMTGSTAGSRQSYTDADVPSNGTHTYEVIPYVGENFGQRASASAFIGQDVPTLPQNIQLLDNTDNILATWDKFSETGANGGYVNPADVAVSFFKFENGRYSYTVGDSVTTSDKGATQKEIPQNPEETTEEDGTTQTFYRLFARAEGNAGNSDYVTAGPVIIGPSIQLPFKESFANGNIENGFAWISGNSQYYSNTTAASWNVDTNNSSDGDGGSTVWHAYTESNGYYSNDYTITPGDEVSFNTPKISLRGTTKPALYFSLYATADDPAKLDVSVQTPDGATHEAKTYDLSSTTATGWTTQSVDLSQFASQRYVIIRFNGIADGEDTYIGLDNINVFDQLEYNLSAEGIKTPKHVTAGMSGSVDVYVKNYGAHAASGYDVVLYSDDKAVDTVTVDRELPILGQDTVSLTLPVAVNQVADISVKAKIIYDNDFDEDNNTTPVQTVKVIPSEYTKVSDLKADASTSDGGKVDLSWSKPSFDDPVTLTEDFENYDAFATQFGDWTLVDGDHGLSGSFFQNVTYPGEGTAFAFDIFNPNAIAADVVSTNPGLTPHSGNQFAGAPYALNPATGQDFLNADNWLISPELSGNEQTITFYALNFSSSQGTYKEKFDVLYSTTGKDTTDFSLIESDIADGTNAATVAPNWKEISVTIPAGARYFAIHNNTDADNSFLFGIDDITYQKGAVGANDSIVAYNIYRDGELIGTVSGSDFNFTDTTADGGSHTYNVTVVYQDANGNKNESGFSNDATIIVTGIEGVKADKAGRYNVYTIDGKAVMLNVTSLSGLKSGLYIINDHKYIIK